MIALTPWVGVPSNVSIDVSRYSGWEGTGEDQPSRDQYQSPDETPKTEGKKEMATYVERTETRAVGVKRLIVEIDELLGDNVDVCHGFSVGGSERVTGRGAWQRWQRRSVSSD
jgi:hypothetical protein